MSNLREQIGALLALRTVTDDDLRALGSRAARPLIAAFERASGPDADADRVRAIRGLGLLGTPL